MPDIDDVNNNLLSVALYKKLQKQLEPIVEKIDALESASALVEAIPGPKGERGARGETGSRGEIGPQGLRGEVGPRGEKGDKGDRGEVGPVGPQGPVGEKGERGEQGERGEIGPVGPQGEVGPRGEKGDAGERGEQGIQGIVGPQGPVGDRGEKGETGDRGEVGPAGEKGDKGDRGEVGPMGSQGDRGEVGPQGPAGEKGEKGDKGDIGERGEKGDTGERGERGEKGDRGEVGPQGERGETGPQGPIGPEGPAGKDAILPDIDAILDPVIERVQSNVDSYIDKSEKTFKGWQSMVNTQLSTIGGGGEVWLSRLNDVDRTSAKVDGAYLKYDAASKKWIGASGGGGTPGEDGASAYEVAVSNGFVGTEEEWLESLVGLQGEDGMSAYEVAVSNGFEGTEQQWLTSLNGVPISATGLLESLPEYASNPLGFTFLATDTNELYISTGAGDPNSNEGWFFPPIKLGSFPIIWWYPDGVSSDGGIPRTQNANAIQIVASGDIVEGQPVPEDITITITAEGIYNVPYDYNLLLPAGYIFDSGAIASNLKDGINYEIFLNAGYENLVWSYNNTIAFTNGPNNYENLLFYKLTCNYGTTSAPANFNRITGAIEFCNYFPDGLGQIVNSTYDGSDRQWICTNLNPIIWTEITQTPNLPPARVDAFANSLVVRDANAGVRAKEFALKNGEIGSSLIIKTDNFPFFNDITYTIPNISGVSNAQFVLTQGSQTINGAKYFNANINANSNIIASGNITGSGTSNLFANEAGDSPHSLLTQQQLMLNGHKFRQGVCVNTKKVGLNPATVAEQFQVLGMKVSIGNEAIQAAAAYTLDGLFCTDISTTTLPINNEVDAYFHGVAMQFLPNANWRARINFGVPYSKSIPYANQTPANGAQQWGVEFSYDSANSIYVGRLYFYYDPPIVYGNYFNLGLYTGANHLSWEGFVYSIRMRQVVVSTNRLRLEFYMNTSSSNNGGTKLSKTTPIATLLTPTITTPNYRFDGKHINFEVASSTIGAPAGQVRMQCTNMYCQFK